jgi:LacI family transcriptional regulator
VGVIIYDIGNPFFSELLAGAHDQLDEHGYTVLLGTTFESKSKQNRLLEMMLEYKVCGLVLFPVAETSLDTIKRFNKLRIPSVVVGRDLPGADIDFVGFENTIGVKMAIQHLIDSGHRQIAFLGGTPKNPTYLARLAGYQAALASNGITSNESLIITSPPTRDGGYSAVDQLLKNGNSSVAVFCYNDITALGAMERLCSLGLEPGSDIAVVGFDNIREASTCRPSLTTVSVNIRQVGIEAAGLLHKRILGFDDPPTRIILPPELIIRNSSANKA